MVENCVLNQEKSKTIHHKQQQQNLCDNHSKKFIFNLYGVNRGIPHTSSEGGYSELYYFQSQHFLFNVL